MCSFRKVNTVAAFSGVQQRAQSEQFMRTNRTTSGASSQIDSAIEPSAILIGYELRIKRELNVLKLSLYIS
jgi:hypothetical protein